MRGADIGVQGQSQVVGRLETRIRVLSGSARRSVLGAGDTAVFSDASVGGARVALMTSMADAPWKRLVGRQHFVEHEADGEEIERWSTLAADLLRRHVTSCAKQHLRSG